MWYSLQNGTNYPLYKQIKLKSYSVRKKKKNKELRKNNGET